MSQYHADVSRERAALMRSQRRKIDLQTARLRAELVPADQIGELWDRLIGNARSRLLAIGAKLGGRLLGQSNPAVVCDKIDAEIHEALNELASEGNLGRLLSELEAEDAGGEAEGVEGAAPSNDKPVGRRKPPAKPRVVKRTRKMDDQPG